MDVRKVGVLAGVVSALSLVAQIVPGVLLDRWMESKIQSELPMMFESVGETALVLTNLNQTGGSVVTVLLGMSLGYYVGRRIAVQSHYRSFIGIVGVGSTVGVLVPWAGSMALSSSFPPLDVGAILLMVVTVVRLFATVSLVIIVGAFAGAALAHFQKANHSPVRPKKTDIENPSRGETATSEGNYS